MKFFLLPIFLLLSFLGFAQTVTEVYYPKYVQGVGSGSPFNDLKVPYACRMTVSGLTPNATYRYYSRFVDNPASVSNGVGSYILVNQTGNFTRVELASMSTPGSYGELTANASGSYTGWFVVEPGSDIAFTPGTLLYWRIMLNNGSGGGNVVSRITATNPVTVINWGTTSGSALEGSAIYNSPIAAYTPKNFVMLYDNIAGTGRPVSGTFIESDGTANTTAEFYDLFYELLVNGQANVWGTIIPNNLANGINNISQYSLANGSFVNKCTSPNGVYGLTDTRNASKGNADPFTPDLLLISCTPNSGCSISLSAVGTNVLCNGGSTGAINLTVSGAAAPLSYVWSNGATTEDLTGLTAGTYTVTVTDGVGCTGTSTVTVTQPSVLSASSTPGTILCNGGTTTVTVTATGGTAPYTGTGTFTRGAGAYSYTVTDANGCTAVTSGTISQPSLLSASSTAPPITVIGGSTTVTVTATGGTAPYTGTGTFVRTAGTYTFTVTDANGCTTTTTITLTEPGCSINITTAVTSVLCNGANTGAVNITVSGATAPVSYAWSNGATTEDLSGVPAGTYTVTVTDAVGCSGTGTATVTQPTALSASSTAPPITVVGGSTTVTVTATGGTAPYTGTGTFIRTAGTYTFTVTDANGCTTTTTITLTNPGCSITLSAVASNVLCNGGSTGAINLTVSGATAPLSYVWSNGATTEDLSGVPAGTYTVTVTDGVGCTGTSTVTVTQPPVLSASSTPGAILCNGGTTTVTVTATGGTAPYTGTGTFTRGAGAYSYTVTDANGCTAVTSGTISQPSLLSASSTAPPITVIGGSTTVTVTATGGTAPYTGTGTFVRTAGTYTFTVTDANGCTTTTTITLTEPGCSINITTAVTSVLCNGANTGAVNITVNGATAPVSYAWSNGATTEDLSGVPAGTYTVTVTDAVGCTVAANATITEPLALTASSSAGTIFCNGASTTVTVTAAGGTAPYTGTGTFTVSAGVYSFTVTDANGCTAVTTGTVTQPSVLSASSTPGTILCNGGSTTVTVTATGGTTPYTGTGTFTRGAGAYSYTVTDANGCTAVTSGTISQPSLLSASSTAPPITVIGGSTTVTVNASGGTAPYTGTGTFVRTAGTYTFTVTDANGCTTTTTITLTEPVCNLAISTAATNVACNGGSTGAINLTVSGATAPLSYNWSNGATTEDLSGIPAGTYTISVTDAVNCTATGTVIITQPSAALIAASSAGTILCNGGTTTVTITATGGTAPYTGTGTFTRGAGSYSYTVTDANGCTSVTTGTIAEPAALAAVSSTGTISCNGGTTTVTVTASGGSAPYTGTGTFTVSAGVYNYTVTDANGCTAITSGTITQPSILSATSTAGVVSCNGGTTIVTVAASGGTAPYTGTGTFTVNAGTYNYTVTDSKGCTSLTSITVTQPAVLTATAATGAVSCNGGTTTILIAATGGTAPYTGTGSFTRGAGTYNFTVTDARGCTATTSVTVTQPGILTATATAGTITQCGGTTLVTVSATGGTTPYPFPGVGSYIRGPGTWSFTVSDAVGCTATAQVTIAAPECLTIFPNPTQSTVLVSHSSARAGAYIQVFSVNGARVANVAIPQGSIRTTIDMRQMAAGFYVLVFYNDGEKRNKIFEKLN